MKKYLEAGKIVSTHGLRGELKVIPWCDSPAFFCSLKNLYLVEGGTPIRVQKARVQKTMVLLTLEGIETVEQGDALRDRVLYLNREEIDLPEGKYFLQDLIGIQVFDAENHTFYGRITNIFETGANDVYEITDEQEKTYLFPAVQSMIAEVNPAEGFIKVRPIKGIFDDEN